MAAELLRNGGSRCVPLLVVQNNHVEPITGPAARAAHRRGIHVHDRSSGGPVEREPVPYEGQYAPILVIGSVAFVSDWAEGRSHLTQWKFWRGIDYDAATWADRLGSHFLNGDGTDTTIGEYQESDQAPHHIRPRGSHKLVANRGVTESETGIASISGMVATPEEIEGMGIDPAEEIWISPVKEIRAEIRVWMIAGEAVAASTYRIDGRHHAQVHHPLVPPAMTFAGRMHAIWHPDRHYVIDLAMTEHGWRVVEYNSVHTSGWYDADPGMVMDAYFAAEAVTDAVA